MPLWTIYDVGTDGYQGYTSRCFLAGRGGAHPTDEVMRSPTLDGLRQVHEECGRTCLARSPEDPPNIIETWI